ncbi:MAG: hypothetical protein JXR97_03575, partial [Planctomycetes bacterium]|nr:hypothetical protein [Planctomycetota bacterium]
MMSYQKFARDESGQSLIFAVLTLFGLVMMSLMILGVAEATSMQMRLQNAADAAAYSGAQVEADCISHMAWLNVGMSDIYYSSMRYAVDNATYATLAELEDAWIAFPSGSKADALGFSDDMNSKWQDAYDVASEEIPRAERWLKRLSGIQHCISSIAPLLIERQVRFSSKYNGAESSFFYPGFVFLQNEAEPKKIVLEIEKVGEMNSDPFQENGWHIWNADNTNEIRAMHTAHIEDPAIPVGTDPVITVDKWDINYTNSVGDGFMNTEISYGPYNSETDSALVGDKPAADGSPIYLKYYKFTWQRPGDDETKNCTAIVPSNDSSKCTVVHGSGDVQVSSDNGVISLTYENGNKIDMRYDDNGMMQYTDDQGNWKDMTNSTSIDVNGVQVPIEFNPHVNVGNGMSMDIADPVRIHIGDMTVILSDPMRIIYYINGIRVEVKDQVATINGLSTNNTGIFGKWQRVHDGNKQQNDSLKRHRILEVEPDVHWTYEFVREGSITVAMDMMKFACHSIMDNDSDYNTFFAPTSYERWCLPDTDDDDTWKDNGMLSSSRWTYYPKWAQPPRTPEELDDREFGGFFRIEAGTPYAKSDDNHYNQTRVCWYCENNDRVLQYCPSFVALNGTPELKNYDLDSGSERYYKNFSNGGAVTRPCGFWNVTFGDEDDMNAALVEAQANANANNTHAPISMAPGADNPYGKYVIQVYCPLDCHWKFTDGAQPKTYGVTEDQIISHDNAVLNELSRVRRDLYYAYERHNKGSRPEPDKRKMDNGYDPTAFSDDGYNSTDDERDFYSVKVDFENPDYFQQPLELSRTAFTTSLTVGTWQPTLTDKIWYRIGGKRNVDASGLDNGSADVDPQNIDDKKYYGSDSKERTGTINPYPEADSDEEWGHFALSTARIFLTAENESGARRTFHRFDESSPWKRDGWDAPIIPNEEPFDELGRSKNWDRERWILSALNLF